MVGQISTSPVTEIGILHQIKKFRMTKIWINKQANYNLQTI